MLGQSEKLLAAQPGQTQHLSLSNLRRVVPKDGNDEAACFCPGEPHGIHAGRRRRRGLIAEGYAARVSC
jgi:hypothetical protein